MSVLKNKRGLSKLEFYHNARRLRKNITDLLLRDFGVRDKVRQIKNEDGEKFTVIEGYPDWLITHFREKVINKMHDLMENITAGNTIYPLNETELQIRRNFQTAAIYNCEQLLQIMHYAEDVLPVAVSKFLPFVDAIEFEIKLLKGWRKANSKLKDKFKK